MWIIPRTELTEDQLAAVNLSSDKHRIIVGGPGSGKTLALAHRARRMLDEGYAPDRVRLLVYTKTLARYLRTGLQELGIPEHIVKTFDAWCLEVYRAEVGGRPPSKKDSGSPDWEAVREAALRARNMKAQGPLLDVVLVDEAQDLDSVAIRLLAATSSHVTLAMDQRQQLYSGKVDVATAADILGLRRPQGNLLTAYRCTPLIVDVASVFLPDDEAERFRASNLLPLAEREVPMLEETTSDEAELDLLAKRLGERALLGQRSAVLVPFRYTVGPVANGLRKRGVNAVDMDEADFDDIRPVVITYHSAKGLTVEAVFLPQLTTSAFPSRDDGTRVRNQLFVGISRATHWVWLGRRAGQDLPDIPGFDQFSALERRGSLKVVSAGSKDEVSQRSVTARARPIAAPAPRADSSTDVRDLL